MPKSTNNLSKIDAKKKSEKIMLKEAQSEPTGSPKWYQILVFYVKKRKKGPTEEPSVH